VLRPSFLRLRLLAEDFRAGKRQGKPIPAGKDLLRLLY
jgi:hypothetical protein